MNESQSLDALLARAKALGADYYAITGRPLGVTGEVAEYEACRLLRLKRAPVREPGYDATRKRNGREQRIQIKGRVLGPSASRGQRIGSIKLNHPWHVVMLVIMDESLNATEIWEAARPALTNALRAPGSRSRNERGALGVAKFKSVGRLVWPKAL